MEEHGLRGKAGAKGHRAALLPGLRCCKHLLQHKHHRGRGHVAEARRMPRECRSASPAGPGPAPRHPARCGRRDARPTDRWSSGSRPRVTCTPASFMRALDLAGNLAGKLHVEAGSRIRQVIRWLVSGRFRPESCRWPARPARALTRLAAQPSAKTRNESTCSRSCVSCRCSVQSSRFSTSTRAEGSERTM